MQPPTNRAPPALPLAATTAESGRAGCACAFARGSLCFDKVVRKCSSFVIVCQAFETREDGAIFLLGGMTQEQATARMTELLPPEIRKVCPNGLDPRTGRLSEPMLCRSRCAVGAPLVRPSLS